MRLNRLPLVAACVLSASLPVFAGGISGDYVETRSADVYTGPCFANGEVNLTGHEAVLAWKVRQGEWKGVDLAGLSVVAVARASATLGDPYRDPYPARSVLIFDLRATAAQKTALADFAKSMAGRLLENVVMTYDAPIQADFGIDGIHCAALVEAGSLAAIRTRGLGSGDNHCGNESAYYPPLAEVESASPAVAVANEYAGNHLGAEWRIYEKRSAFVGSFAR